MFSKPFKCNAPLPKGQHCDEMAKVTDAEYVFRKDFIDGRFEQIVDEVQYTMECPKCGPWKRVECVHMNQTFARS